MGCDIHMFVETLTKDQYGSTHWISQDHWEYDPDLRVMKVSYDNQVYNERNYVAFSVLADVRNHKVTEATRFKSFIDWEWESLGCKVLMNPRGIPDDCDGRIEADYKNWSGDAHSASYLYLNEVLEFDWTQNLPNSSSTYEKECKYFLSVINKLSKAYDPQKSRLVFWFDN